LTEWNPERGFGAVTPVQGGETLFVHISAFPIDAAVPTLGEALSFELVTGRDGRKQAARVQRSKRIVSDLRQQRLLAPAPRRQHGNPRRRSMTTTTALLLVGLVMSLAALGWMHGAQHGGVLLAQRVGGVALR
jgi:cold shock CspA family protein